MKKLLFVILTLVMALSVSVGLTACRQYHKDDGEYISDHNTFNLIFELINNDTEYSVKGYEGEVTEIVIPSIYKDKPVTRIGDWAFSSCRSLTNVEIPTCVTSIGKFAFHYCDSLKSVEIPGSVTNIGTQAFANCYLLTSVTIGESVKSIGDFAFACCNSLTNIEVSEKNMNYKSVDGNVYSKDETTLIKYANGKTATSFIIPNSVTSIGDSAFYSCGSLMNIEIPSSVTSIGDSAFSNCDLLTSIELPNSVTSIGDSAFSNCDLLKRIEIPNSVTSIGCDVLKNCDSLTNIEVSENNANYKSIDGNLYSKDGKILIQYAKGKKATNFNIPSGVIIMHFNIFFDCNFLTRIEIPSSVTSIGDSEFAFCNSLTSIEVSVNNVNYKSIDGNLYSKDEKTLIQYASGKTETSFTIPSSVTNINSYAFSRCSSLTIIEIPNSVTSIENYAFSKCKSLTSICFGGTTSQWREIKKSDYWNDNAFVLRKVVCKDGEVTL